MINRWYIVIAIPIPNLFSEICQISFPTKMQTKYSKLIYQWISFKTSQNTQSNSVAITKIQLQSIRNNTASKNHALSHFKKPASKNFLRTSLGKQLQLRSTILTEKTTLQFWRIFSPTLPWLQKHFSVAEFGGVWRAPRSVDLWKSIIVQFWTSFQS